MFGEAPPRRRRTKSLLLVPTERRLRKDSSNLRKHFRCLNQPSSVGPSVRPSVRQFVYSPFHLIDRLSDGPTDGPIDRQTDQLINGGPTDRPIYRPTERPTEQGSSSKQDEARNGKPTTLNRPEMQSLLRPVYLHKPPCIYGPIRVIASCPTYTQAYTHKSDHIQRDRRKSSRVTCSIQSGHHVFRSISTYISISLSRSLSPIESESIEMIAALSFS